MGLGGGGRGGERKRDKGEKRETEREIGES